MLKEMMNAAVRAAVDVVLESKTDAVREDVSTHMLQSVLAGEQIEGVAERLLEMVQKLSEQFEVMPLKQAHLAGYLLENLDLPRNNLSTPDINALIALADLGDTSSEIVVAPSTIDLSLLPLQFVSVKRQDDLEDGHITHTVVGVRVDDKKTMLFLLTKGLVTYEVTKTESNILVERKPEYTVNEFAELLESISDTQFAPPLMSDRPTIELPELTVDWLIENAADLPEDAYGNPQSILDAVVSKFVKEKEVDTTGKRIDLENINDLIDAASSFVKTEEDSEADEPVNEMPDMDDEALFSQGVTEQPEETVAPETEESFDTVFDEVIEDAVVLEEDGTSFSSSIEVAVAILKEMQDNPDHTLRVIDNSNLLIKEAVYNEVLRTLPVRQGRSPESYSVLEKTEIRNEMSKHIFDVLGSATVRRKELETERLASLPFNEASVKASITENPIHSEGVPEDELDSLIVSVVEYLNSHYPEVTDNHDVVISEVLNNLSLYDYETESLINSTYRATNVPPAGNLIKGTPVITRILRKLYRGVKFWSDVDTGKVENILKTVFSGQRLALDLTKEEVSLLISSKGSLLEPKSFTKAGRFVIASTPNTRQTTHSMLVIMTGSEAQVLNINNADQNVVGVETIKRADQRLSLLKTLATL